MKKKCFKCGAVKARTEFYRHSQMADGLLGKCKKCAIMDSLAHRAENLDTVQAYDRNRPNAAKRKILNRQNYHKRVSTPEGRAKENERGRKHREKNKLARAAHILCQNAVSSGRLKRMPCERCNSTKRIHAHHENYHMPMEVTWLCRDCHGLRHREINEAKRA